MNTKLKFADLNRSQLNISPAKKKLLKPIIPPALTDVIIELLRRDGHT